MKMADLFFREGTGFEVEGGQVPINGKCCQLHLIMNRLGFSMRKFCLSERAAHFFKAALALFVLGQNIVPGGGHAVEFKSLQKGHELSFFMHTLLLTCSARRHRVHNQRWAAASGKAALALPQPPGQDWFAGQLKKRLAERMLEAELSHHLKQQSAKGKPTITATAVAPKR